MVELMFLYVDEFGNFSGEELQKELLGEDSVIGGPDCVCAANHRWNRFTPDELERYFGIPKEKGKEEKDHA